MNSLAPAVSVILPVYNAGRTIGAAIESILSQTYTDFEVMVIDDGSTDDTQSVVQGFDDPRVRVLRNPQNMGLVASLNRGIAETNGLLLARMDADDVTLPERLAVQVQTMQANPRLGVVSCHYETFDDQCPLLEKVVLPTSDGEVRYDLYAKSHCFCHPAALMRRQALEQASGYKAEWFPAEDRELWMRMLEAWQGANVPQVLHRVRKHERSISSQNMKRQASLVLKATAERLTQRLAPHGIDIAAQHAGWARGELFVAFGLAEYDDSGAVGWHLQQAATIDRQTVLASFKEIMTDRVVTYMHHSKADIAGCKRLVRRVFEATPSSLNALQAVRPQVESQIHAIAAFYHADLGQRTLSQREAMRALTIDASQWRNRGLLKLALRGG